MLKKIKLKNLSQYFYFGIKWNAIEVIFYQMILIGHQILLYNFTKNSDYGIIASVFSFIYLSILFFNFGLDKSLTPFFKTIKESKNNFKKYFLYQIFAQFFILSLSLSISLLILNFFDSKITFLSKIDIIIIALIIISESLRKTLRAFAQLSFLNNQTALLEILSVIIYVALFWILYWSYKNVNLTNSLIPLLIESLFSIFLLILITKNLYKSLPEIKDSNILSYKEIAINRFNIFITQISNTFFSSNFILPFIAYRFGFEAAGTLQISKSIITFFYILFEKTFGITSGSLLTRVKKDIIEKKQENYNLTTSSVYNSISFIIIFFSLTLLVFKLSSDVCFFYKLSEGYLFGLALLTTILFIPQEQLLLVEERIYYLTTVNILNGIILYLSITLFNLKISLIAFVLSRLFFLFITSFIIKKRLYIKTKFNSFLYYLTLAIILFTLSMFLFDYC